MQDIVVPPLVPVVLEGNLADLPRRWAQRDPGRVLLRVKHGESWREVSAAEFDGAVRALAKGFVAAGVEVGDRVGIMSRTRYEWTLTDFALWTAGAVPVPIYETSSAEQLAWICSDSAAVAVVLEDAGHASTLSEVREQTPTVRDVWQIDTGALDELCAAGSDVSDTDLDGRRDAVDRASLATIIYTSGTTGEPKGCELTHDNFMALTENATERLQDVVAAPGASTLLFLPLAHVFARFVQVLALQSGSVLGHTADPTELLSDLGTFRPTYLLAVPRVFEKIYNSSQQKAQAAGRGRVFAWAARVAIAWSRAQDAGGTPVRLRLQHRVADRLVYGRLRAAMGGRLQYAVSGGAALGERLGHFFRGIGVVILEGYGLTETTAPSNVNTPDLVKIGTVGRPLPGVGVRIAADGEVLIKGNNVFRGYHGNDAATDEAIRDGWFHTGDLGELDDDGFLRITGRSKELLVTAAGKNVSPAVLEDRLRADPLISQCMVVGDGKPFIAALITLDEEMLATWASTHGLPGLTVSAARTHELVLAEVQRAIDRANEAVSRAESIRRFEILEEDFTEANGYLTPSMKLRRGRVLHDLADRVEALYPG